MAQKKQNLVEEALLQMENLKEAVTENAKGILASTMKEEISELVKESLSEDEIEDEVSVEAMEGQGIEKGVKHETKEQDELDIEDDMELDVDMDIEDESDEDEDDMEIDTDEMLMMDLPGDELEVDDEEEILLPLDLTGASDEEILKVFKAMGEEDGIVVTQDGDEITLKDDEADVEYQIQMEEFGGKKDDDPKSHKDYEESNEGDEVVYEIELGEEDDEEYDHYHGAEEDDAAHIEDLEDDMEDDAEKTEAKEDWGSKKHEYRRKDVDGVEKKAGEGKGGHFKDYEEAKEDWGSKKHEYRRKDVDGVEKKAGEGKDGHFKDYEEAKEGMVRSHAAGSKASSDKSKGLPKPHSIPNRARYNESLEKEVKQLREKNEEYRKALNIFKEKLNEVAVFNSNLAYATRLFTEHSTTKQEKINILRRFDSAETIKESKSLYKTVKEDLDSKGSSSVVTESVASKVQKSPSKGSATNLIESKTYENPQFMRMKDLMGKLQK